MSERPVRCPFCSNTDLAPAGAQQWSCVGSLGCGGVWDPAVTTAPPPRAERPEEAERDARPLRTRGHRLLRRTAAARLFDAA